MGVVSCQLPVASCQLLVKRIIDFSPCNWQLPTGNFPLATRNYQSETMYLFLAEALVVFHFCFVLFVLSGGFLLSWRKWIACLHIPAALWGVIVESTGGHCPLTPLENRLREAVGGVPYEGGFVEHYIMPIVYPHEITYDFQLTLAMMIAVINIVLYTFAFTRRGAACPNI